MYLLLYLLLNVPEITHELDFRHGLNYFYIWLKNKWLINWKYTLSFLLFFGGEACWGLYSHHLVPIVQLRIHGYVEETVF